MTVSTTSNKIIYSGNAADTVFPFTFSVEEAANLVISYTDADGIITDVTADSTILVNAAIPPNPTPVGGSVTYPTSGSPIALGTFLTIYRDLSEVQTTSLDNQGTLYPPVIEAALDYLTMLTQQIQELNGRAIVVAVSDPDPEPLPPVAQRASMLMGFDSDGNPIAVALTSGSQVLVSTAMIPVVEAATLALARTAMGLGNIAVENIGAALEDDGAGAVRFISTPVVDAVDKVVNTALHMQERHATAAITYTCPRISTLLFTGFGFYIYALGGDVTIAINANDAFRGQSNGVSLVIPNGSRVFLSCDGVATWYVRGVVATPPYANAANLTISASVTTNNLTIAIKDRNGNNPSATSPILFCFRDSTITSGIPVYIALTSALSIVAAAGATLGFTNSVPGRVWLVAFNDAGTIRLGLINCLNAKNIFPLGQNPVSTTTLISAGATSTGVFYTNGAAITPTARSYVVLGFLTWEDGNTLATAGNWSAGPSVIELYGPGVPLPGNTIQTAANNGGGAANGAVATGTTVIPGDDTIPQSGEGDAYLTQAITPTSAANAIESSYVINLTNSAATIMAAALFSDQVGANAVSAMECQLSTTGRLLQIADSDFRQGKIRTAITMTVRAGGTAAGTTTVNGSAGARLFGGAMISKVTTKEIQA